MTRTNTTQSEQAAYDRARRRVREEREFWGHFWFFVVVMTVLVLVDLADGSEDGETLLGLDWAYFPLIGWGAFVVAHFLSGYVFNPRFGAGWEDRKVEEYVRREREQSDSSQSARGRSGLGVASTWHCDSEGQYEVST